MNEEEALIAVEPPLTLADEDTDPSDHEAVDGNPYNLKECFNLSNYKDFRRPHICSSSKNPLVELK